MHCFEILTFEKYRDCETLVRGHSLSLEMMQFDRSYVTSYRCYCGIKTINHSTTPL